MKMRSMRKLLATTLSAAMVMGMSATVFAAPGDGSEPPAGVDVTAPIYSYDLVNVVVPSAYAVAFNPDGLTVTVEGSTTSTDQIVSKNYGIVNKSTKDKLVTVKLTVADQNTNSDIEFVDSEDKVTNAVKDTHVIYLTAVPADATEVQVGNNSADKDTAAAALGNVTMTKSTTQKVVLSPGENKIGFKLDKATYALKSGSSITLGTDTGNSVADKYEISALAGSGKGITAFTLDGKMNTNTDWTAVTAGVKISVVYEWKTAESTDTVLTGTGAMVQLVEPDVAPSIANVATMVADQPTVITLNMGSGASKATSVTSYKWNGTEFLDNGVTYADGKLTVAVLNTNYFLNDPDIDTTFVLTFDNGKTVTGTLR